MVRLGSWVVKVLLRGVGGDAGVVEDREVIRDIAHCPDYYYTSNCSRNSLVRYTATPTDLATLYRSSSSVISNA